MFCSLFVHHYAIGYVTTFLWSPNCDKIPTKINNTNDCSMYKSIIVES